LYEIFTPFSCFESTTVNPSGVGGKYCAAAVPTSETAASQVVGTIVASGEVQDSGQEPRRRNSFKSGISRLYESMTAKTELIVLWGNKATYLLILLARSAVE
jgi:hypothetical protein